MNQNFGKNILNKVNLSKQYDIIIVTHLPSSYKVNLYNEVAKNKKIYVLFIAHNSLERTNDFLNLNCEFEYQVINNCKLESRNRYISSFKLIQILKRLKSKYLIVNGWDLLEFWVCILLPFFKKGIALESTIYESNFSFFHRTIKCIFLYFTHFALPSGEPHFKVLSKLKYKKEHKIVSGVGIPNIYYQQKSIFFNEEVLSNDFIFIGRLVKEKNINLLIQAFSKLPHINLTIVGSGPLEIELKKNASKNVNFIGHVDNSKLHELLNSHNSLILPSISETWGLVIEEALIYELPVIISSIVGCSIDIVKKYNVGCIFENNNADSLINKIEFMLNHDTYKNYKNNIKSIHLNEMYSNQINAYSLNWINC